MFGEPSQRKKACTQSAQSPTLCSLSRRRHRLPHELIRVGEVATQRESTQRRAVGAKDEGAVKVPTNLARVRPLGELEHFRRGRAVGARLSHKAAAGRVHRESERMHGRRDLLRRTAGKRGGVETACCGDHSLAASSAARAAP